MAINSDDGILLPAPPPPRPAARRAAIDAALSRFDGRDGADDNGRSRRPEASRWTNMHRRPAGALVAVAVIAIIGIPAIQIALRDEPLPIAEDIAPSGSSLPRQEEAGCIGAECREPAPAAPSTAAGGSGAVAGPAEHEVPPAVVETARNEPAAMDSLRDRNEADAAPAAELQAQAPLEAPAAPSPPPPPPPMARQLAKEDRVVVTGSRMRRQDEAARQAGHARAAEAPASTAPGAGLQHDFLNRLQSAFRSGNRDAVIALVGFPLRVEKGDRARSVRNAAELRPDFEQVFTPEVRDAVLELRPDSLASRDGGRLLGHPRLWFGCPAAPCVSGAQMRIMQVRP